MDKYYSVRELTEILSIPKSTIYRWVREGSIPHYKINGYIIRFKEKDIIKWLERYKKEEKRPEYLILN